MNFKNYILFESLKENSIVSDEILEKVKQRTLDHIERVKYFYNLLKNEGVIPKDLVNISISNHDEDKLIPYNLYRQALRFCTTDPRFTENDMQMIQDVVHDHVKSNKHHCEYWGNGDHRTSNMDCSSMPNKYVYEMMADWAATAEERGGDVNSWFKFCVINVGGKRWKFNNEQIEIMKECIPFLDKHLDKSLKRDYGLVYVDPAFIKK